MIRCSCILLPIRIALSIHTLHVLLTLFNRYRFAEMSLDFWCVFLFELTLHLVYIEKPSHSDMQCHAIYAWNNWTTLLITTYVAKYLCILSRSSECQQIAIKIRIKSSVEISRAGGKEWGRQSVRKELLSARCIVANNNSKYTITIILSALNAKPIKTFLL